MIRNNKMVEMTSQIEKVNLTANNQGCFKMDVQRTENEVDQQKHGQGRLKQC